MVIQPLVITQSNYGNSLSFTLQDGNGNPLNLTSASLTLKVQDAQDPSGTLLFSKSMTIDSPTAGTCHYTVANGDFPNPGTFLAEIVVTVSSTLLQSYGGIRIIVQPTLPQTIN